MTGSQTSITGVMTKTCTRCGTEKPLDAFSPNPRSGTRRQSWCRACYAAYARERRRENAATAQRTRRVNRARHRALEQLRPSYPSEFRALYAAELERATTTDDTAAG